MRLTNPNTDRHYEVADPVYRNEAAGVVCYRTEDLFIKVFSFTPQTRNAVLRHARNETEALQLASGCNPHVPAVLDHWVDSERYVLVMSQMPGVTLGQWVERHKKDKPDAGFLYHRSRLMLQVIRILQDIHSRYPALCHRDLKPDNILVEEAGTAPQVSLIDFGCTKILQMRGVGTPAFQPPEQRHAGRSEIFSHKSDIFSLGLIFYWLLTGTVPAIGSQLVADSSGTQWKVPPMLPKKLLSLPSGPLCNRLLQDMLQLLPEQRPDYNRIVRTILEIKEESPCRTPFLSFFQRKNGKP